MQLQALLVLIVYIVALAAQACVRARVWGSPAYSQYVLLSQNGSGSG